MKKINREPIKLNDNFMNSIIKMSEGNPGGLRVLLDLMNKELGLIYILGLDDMNIRGWQIWFGYKDHCNSNIEKFIECIKNRDIEMINIINKEAMRMNIDIRAVIGGASFKR